MTKLDETIGVMAAFPDPQAVSIDGAPSLNIWSPDMSGSMQPEYDPQKRHAHGGTAYEPIVCGGGTDMSAIIHEMQRMQAARAPAGRSSGSLIVFTDGEPAVDMEPIRAKMLEMPDPKPAYAVMRDHSGSTVDGKVRREGFWFSPSEPDLPVPECHVDWPARDRFLERLATLEEQAGKRSYRGVSPCRVCGMGNGSKTLSLGAWEWPSGYAHYLREHGVRPSPAFEGFVDGAFIKVS